MFRQLISTSLVLLLTLCLWHAVSASGETNQEFYFKFKTPPRARLDKITRLISIDNVTADEVRAYANADELASFQALGIDYELLPHPGTLIRPRMASSAQAAEQWDSYPTYSAYVAMMYQFQTDHPDLCQIMNAGTTVDGRAILFARISHNVGLKEDEPEVMYTSSMHGDETTGYILCLRLIDSLLNAYGVDPYVTRLVDSLEIWINPLANPDGAYFSGDNNIYGSRRYNANGVDLNRNFPDPAEGDHPDGRSWQPETVAMINLADAHNFVISANHHGGAEVLNYPWDTWSGAHPDQNWYLNVCLAWAQSAQAASPSDYMESFQFPNGITNGYAWYRVVGGRQDFMTYWHGCREITAELSNIKLLPTDQLPSLWDYNRQGLLGYLENALYGVRGLVTDASTGLPVAATIRALGHDVDNSQAYTDAEIGDYHRMLSAGSYDLEFNSLGYQPDTVSGISVVNGQSTRVDVALQPLTGIPILALYQQTIDWISRGNVAVMRITLTNSGDGNATAVTGTLQTTDPYVAITQNSTAFPTIPGLGGTGQSLVDVVLDVSSNCPLNHFAQMELLVSAAGGYSNTVPVGLLVEPVKETFESGTFANLPWSSFGDAPWGIELVGVDEGLYSARSGLIGDYQSSRFEITLEVSHSGKISFDVTVSSEAGYDFLRFYIDDIQKGSWSGEQDWNQVGYDVTPGPHTFAWVYSKDIDVSSGQDRAMIDKVVFPPLVSHLGISTLSPLEWTVGKTYNAQLETTGQLGSAFWSDKYGDLNGTWLALSGSGQLSGTPLSTGLVQFTGRVEDATGATAEKLLTVTVNAAPQIISENLTDANRGESYQFQLEVVNGTPPFIWIETSGCLSGTGLTLSPEGLLAGIPTVYGQRELHLTVTDLAGVQDSKVLQLRIVGGCCVGIVGDANYDGSYDPTIGDVSTIIDMLFISGAQVICLTEADVNQSGGVSPTVEDITIGDISMLIDNLFISGTPLPACL